MPTRWQSFPVSMQGGLITNLSPLKQGLEAPGSAIELINFEPSTEGGYRRIKGFEKYDSNIVPPYGEPKVQASGQTGTSLNIANIHTTPVDGDTFTIAGVTGTYTIAGGGVSFNSTNNTATLTLTTSLASSPADQVALTFNNTADLIEGINFYNEKVIVYRNSDLWDSSGSGWTKINVPSYGTCLVDGGAQTGGSLAVDGLTTAPRAGDTFIIDGVEQTYTVTANATLTGDAATLTIAPNLASSPADNASVTFTSTERAAGNKHRFEQYNFSGTETLIGVDGVNLPFKWDGITFTELTGVPSEVQDADYVVEFKKHIFFAKGNNLVFSAYQNDTDYTVANGAGSILLPSDITGLIVFREDLIIFCSDQIHRVTGNTVSSFQLNPISKDIGCIESDTIQEVGGDILFLGPDGVRFLSSTDRIGDFAFAIASRAIQSDVVSFKNSNESFSSLVIRSKSQYRLFGYRGDTTENSSRGFVGTQFADQSAQGVAWAKLRGFKVYVSDSKYSTAQKEEVIVFANTSGYVYQMDSSNSMDGGNILASYYTPYWPINDPKFRKTAYKLHTYLDTSGTVNGSANLKFDFNGPNVIQPPSVDIVSNSTGASFYGTSTYGTGTYGGRLDTEFSSQVVGSGYTISVQYTFESNDPPFSLDSIVLEYSTEDRK